MNTKLKSSIQAILIAISLCTTAQAGAYIQCAWESKPTIFFACPEDAVTQGSPIVIRGLEGNHAVSVSAGAKVCSGAAYTNRIKLTLSGSSCSAMTGCYIKSCDIE